ncbi:hypothetical protein [Lacinutrix sp. 5H-3-7-4]|uniref:hypothetical protein n=1 Tax=Lacinutrix sp. (strain 5H-3-7-4) TaxID=983544 RepID=UPI0011D1A0A1|nr:hypothetical protein [Lacinutrix sp. 5H-3-7-4]
MQKKLAKCSPDIAEFLRCYISPSEFDLSGDNYDQYRERIIRNFLSQEFNDVLEVLTMRFKKVEDIEEVDELDWEEMIEEGHFGIDDKFMSHFIKYMVVADRLTTFKSILESVEKEKKQQEKEKLTNPVMNYTNYQNDEPTDVFIVEELEKRLAIEAVEYKRKLDDEWEKYTFDPMYFDNFISGNLYNEFLKSLYERIKPLNDFEVNKYLTLSVNQFKTHTPEKRVEAFKKLYYETYWFPNYMEYKEESYISKYAMHVWKHYKSHFNKYKEATENVLQDFKNGLIGSGKKEITEKPKSISKSKYNSFTYINNLTGQTQLTDLMNALKRKNFIENSTDLKDFRKIFSGEEIEKPIVWTGKISELSYFIKQLHNELKLVVDLKQQQWAVTINCFIQENGEQYNRTKLRTQKVPTTSKSIDSALNTLK